MVFDAIRENLRQQQAFDEDFLRAPVYYFELRVPAESNVNGLTSFVFPLVLAPEQLSISEPFTLTETETQGAGLWIERNGIISRTIKLKATTGFKPRRYLGDAFQTIQGSTIRKGHNRDVLNKSLDNARGILEFSGQRHFQFLQDAVFRTYSDLLQTPAYAKDTFLVWHNPKDDEHWMVEPRSFSGDRNSGSSRTTYPYEIELLAYAPADDLGRTFSEDKNIIDAIKDGLRMVNSAVRTARGAIQDITALANEIEGVVNGFGTILNNAVNILDDAAALVDGTASLIASPFDAVASVTNNISQSLELLVNSTIRFPDTVLQSIRKLEDSFDRLAQFPDLYQTGTTQRLQSARQLSELSTSKTQAELEAAAARGPPNSFQAVLALGTANLPGDLLKAEGELGINRTLVQYQSATEYVVKSGDTLYGLAARFLGDAREWRAIATLNGFRTPYVSTSGIPGTATIGSTILIPSTNPPPVQRALTPVLGVGPKDSGAERLLGTDLLLRRTEDAGDTFDLVIDTQGGSTDIKSVSGVQNLSQGLLTRVRTEKGTNQLYRELGVDRIVATQSASLDRDLAIFRVAQSVRADPRVVSVNNIRVQTQTPGDAINIELDVQPINFSGSVPVNLEV